jgi:hypothetical protein
MDSTTSIVTAFRQWGDQCRWRWPVLVSCCFVLGVVPTRPVEGHGYMSEPRPREMDHLKGDVIGWPIAGAPPRYTRADCLDIPVNKRFTVVQPGALKLRSVFPDGANHCLSTESRSRGGRTMASSRLGVVTRARECLGEPGAGICETRAAQYSRRLFGQWLSLFQESIRYPPVFTETGRRRG